MEFTKLVAPSLKELFIKELEHMILSGKLKIGEKLPAERVLADTMQVSRAVVNSGILDLEKKGFLIIKPRVGTFVADYRRNGTLDTLVAIMNYNSGRLGNDEIRSILEVRIALEIMAVELCMNKLQEDMLGILDEKIQLVQTTNSITEASNYVFDFQHEIALQSGNTLLPLIFYSFKIVVVSLWERFCTLYGIDALYQNNIHLLELMKENKKEEAIAWIESTLKESIEGERPIYY